VPGAGEYRVTLADDVRNAVRQAIVRLAVRRRTASITTGAPLTITLEGDSAAVDAVSLTSYTPTAGDLAQVLLTPGALPLVLGRTSSDIELPALVTDVNTAGPTSGTNELTIETATVTLDGLTRVRVVLDTARIDTGVAADTYTFRIKDGSTVERTFRYNATGGASTGIRVEWISDTAPAAGSHTFTATVLRSSGTGTLSINASSTNLIQFSIVEFR
jgi:hypothetical protein